MRNHLPDPARRHASIAATSLLLALLSAGTAHAQSAEAEALFDAGDKLMTEGKLAEACESFEASNRAESRAGTLIRLGECREQNHQLASAWSAYKDALTRVKDPNKRAIATEKVAQLEPRLSHLTVLVGAEHRPDGLAISRNGKAMDPALWNRAMPLDGGDYVVTASAPGFTAWSGTITVPEERGEPSLQVPVLEATPVAVVEKPRPVETPPPSMFTPMRKVSMALAGVSAVSLVVGVVLGASAKGKQHDAEKLCPDPQVPCASAAEANALSSNGHDRATMANFAFGVAAAAAIGAGVLWVVGHPEESAPRVAAVPLASGVAFTLSGRF